MEPFTFFWIFLAIILGLGTVPIQGELKSVTLLFRHGERTPRFIAPNYGDSEIFRDLGPAELTLTGSRQSFENGVALRNIYSSLLDNSGYFRTGNVKIRSSSSKRCVQSASAFLAGFLPPPNTDKRLPIPWQPIPLSIDNEATILTWTDICPGLEKEETLQNILRDSDPIFLQWLAEDREILDRLEVFLGFPINTINQVNEAVELLSACEHLDPTIPYPIVESISHLKRYMIKSFGYSHGTLSLQRFRGGRMITEITENMVAMNQNSTLGQEVIIYSAHDATIIGLAIVLGVWPQLPKWPEYADTLAVEMHKEEGMEAEVRVFYNRNVITPKSRVLLEISACGIPCTLSKFREIMGPFMVTDMKALCA